MPVKCGGAPLKAMFLSHDDFAKRDLLNKTSVEFWACWTNMFPAAPTFAGPVDRYAREKKIKKNF